MPKCTVAVTIMSSFDLHSRIKQLQDGLITECEFMIAMQLDHMQLSAVYLHNINDDVNHLSFTLDEVPEMLSGFD